MSIPLDGAFRRRVATLGDWLTADVPALPLDVFRALTGLVLAAYCARHLVQSADWFGPHALVDIGLTHRTYPATWLSVFQPGLPLGVVRLLWGTAVALSFCVALGVRVRACAAGLLVISASSLRSIYLVSYIDDYFLNATIFWLALLPCGTTLRVRDFARGAARGEVRREWRDARVPGLPVKLFLANIGLIYLDAGLWKLTSAFWRAGFGLFAVLHMPIAYWPDLASASLLPALRFANGLALVSEPLIPLLLLLPKGTPLRRLAIPLAIGLHGIILATVRVPFINLVMPASLLVFFRDDVMALLERPSQADGAVPERTRSARARSSVTPALHLSAVLGLAYLFTVTLSLVSEVPPLAKVGRGARVLLSHTGLVQSYRLFDWVDQRNVAWTDLVSSHLGGHEEAGGSDEPLDADSLWPSGIRGILLRAYVAGVDWQFIPPEEKQVTLEGLRLRLASRFCAGHPEVRTVSVAARPTPITPSNLALEPYPDVKMLRFSCRADGSASLAPRVDDPRVSGAGGVAANAPLEFPKPRAADAYAGSEACSECHRSSFEHWNQSAHGRSMGLPTTESVRGDFHGSVEGALGASVAPREEHGQYAMDIGAATERARYPVDIALGAGLREQAYLTRSADGRIATLPVAWAAERRRWVPATAYASGGLEPDQPGYWRNADAVAGRCLECHASQAEYRVDGHASSVEWRESRVGCEECHGPGAAHARAVRAGRHDERLPSLTSLPKEASVRRCGRCHGLSAPFEGSAAPSALPERLFATLAEAAFWPDGSARRTTYQYGQVVLSECYGRGGATCVTCHGGHESPSPSPTGPKANDSGPAGACLGCHQGLSPTEAQRTHTHHPDSVRCVDCHMPRNKLDDAAGGGLSTNHTVSIPRPRESLEAGVPNACTQCHADRSQDWALASLRSWGATRATETRPWVRTLAMAKRHRPDQFQALLDLVQTETRVPILGASLRLLTDYPPDAAAVEPLRPLAEHPDPVVRAAAVGALIQHDAVNARSWRQRGTQDEHPFVRLIAFESEQDPRTLTELEKEAYQRDLLAESLIPLPGAFVNLARLRATLGEIDEARSILLLAQALATPTEAARMHLQEMQSQLVRARGGEH